MYLARVGDFSPHETFSLSPDSDNNPNPRNLSPNPNTNSSPPVAVTGHKIKGREVKCRNVNYPVPLGSACEL